MNNPKIKAAEDKVEDLKKAIQDLGYDIKEAGDEIEILEKNAE